MEKGLFVKDILPGQVVKGLFYVEQAYLKQARTGQAYWSLKLKDVSGTLEAKVWKPELSGLKSLPEVGQVLEVAKAKSDQYLDQLQLVIEKANLLPDSQKNGLDPSFFLGFGPFKVEALWARLEALISEHLCKTPWEPLLYDFLSDEALTKKFKLCPGAKRLHHAYLGGLLEHSLTVLELCLNFAKIYQDLDGPTLLSGALFHDIGKLEEYSYNLSIEITPQGKLLGHMVLGTLLLEPRLKKAKIPEILAEHLRHLILSHHGSLEYGACVLPQTKEALALHFADNLDAKMHMAKKALESVEPLGWTQKLPGLDQRTLCKMPNSVNLTKVDQAIVNLPPPSSGPKTGNIKAPQAGDADCLSLLKV